MMAAADTLEITGIGQIAINCHDLKRATEFYRDTLGMRMLYEFPGLAFFDCGGVRLMLAEPEKKEFDHPASVIYYRVGDIQQASRTLIDKGIELRVGQGTIDVAVTLGKIARNIVCPQQHFQGTSSANETGESCHRSAARN